MVHSVSNSITQNTRALAKPPFDWGRLANPNIDVTAPGFNVGQATKQLANLVEFDGSLNEPHSTSGQYARSISIEDLCKKVMSKIGTIFNIQFKNLGLAINNGGGSSTALRIIAKVLNNPGAGDKFLTSVDYPEFITGVTEMGGKIEVVAPKAFIKGNGKSFKLAHDIEEMTRRIAQAGHGEYKAVYLSIPSNPLGSTNAFKELKALAAVTKSKNTALIVDVAYKGFLSKLWLKGFAKLADAHEHIVVVTTTAKTFGQADNRIGAVFGHKSFLDIYKKAQALVPLDQHQKTLLENILETGETTMKKIHNDSRAFQNWFAKYLRKKGFAVSNIKGAPNFNLIAGTEKFTANDISKILLEKGKIASRAVNGLNFVRLSALDVNNPKVKANIRYAVNELIALRDKVHGNSEKYLKALSIHKLAPFLAFAAISYVGFKVLKDKLFNKEQLAA